MASSVRAQLVDAVELDPLRRVLVLRALGLERIRRRRSRGSSAPSRPSSSYSGESRKAKSMTVCLARAAEARRAHDLEAAVLGVLLELELDVRQLGRERGRSSPACAPAPAASPSRPGRSFLVSPDALTSASTMRAVALLLDLLQHLRVAQRLLASARSVVALDLAALRSRQLDVLGRALEQEVLERLLVLEVHLGLALLHLEERRLRDEEVVPDLAVDLALDDLGILPIEERQQQRADVAAVDVGVGHDDDAVVAELVDVLVFADAAAERGDQRGDQLATTASCRGAPSRRSGSCRAAAGSPGTASRAPAWPSRRPSRPRR